MWHFNSLVDGDILNYLSNKLKILKQNMTFRFSISTWLSTVKSAFLKLMEWHLTYQRLKLILRINKLSTSNFMISQISAAFSNYRILSATVTLVRNHIFNFPFLSSILQLLPLFHNKSSQSRNFHFLGLQSLMRYCIWNDHGTIDSICLGEKATNFLFKNPLNALTLLGW